jgi:hypothetical protein
MTITVANTSNTNTFEYWVNRTNELADAMTNKVVTVDSNSAVGDAAVTGNFYATTIKVGNSTVNTTFGTPSSVEISSGEYFLNANGSWSPALGPISNGSLETSGTDEQVLDQYNASEIRAAEYSIHIEDNNANGYQLSKILTLHSGNSAASGNAYTTEYGIVTSNTLLATFSANVIGANVVLNVTPVSTNTNISFTRIRL